MTRGRTSLRRTFSPSSSRPSTAQSSQHSARKSRSVLPSYHRGQCYRVTNHIIVANMFSLQGDQCQCYHQNCYLVNIKVSVTKLPKRSLLLSYHQGYCNQVTIKVTKLLTFLTRKVCYQVTSHTTG